MHCNQFTSICEHKITEVPMKVIKKLPWDTAQETEDSEVTEDSFKIDTEK